MSYYKPKRRTYKSYRPKKTITKAVVKSLITKSTDWNYFIRNEYVASTGFYYLLSLTDKNWTETGKTILKQLQLRFSTNSDGIVRAIVIQSEDKLSEYNDSTQPAFLSEVLTDTSSHLISPISCVYPDNKKYKILMDKTYLQDANGNGSPFVIQRTFNKMSPLTLSNSAAAPVGHIYLLIIKDATNSATVSSVLKYSA